MLQRRLEGGWSIMVAGLAVALLACLDLSFSQWRVLVVIGLLATALMLYHKTLRHFVLLPSCVAFASGLLLIVMNLGAMR
ncbi:DUF1435 domain-containing protein [Cedecea sp. NFIX57]|uniref:DUF1435 domain-containing protein n=1 Tax=Cedecea sp. NFIX57 TaxID=1566286 RepID=UPI000A0D09F4|nr:DUF1435 domain-containing protein [Cedecea sp. NFIX57]SMG47211.1 Protein of unknown function [Cedecea sp. NFIX57]